jgi:putative hemolysin
LEYDSSTWVDLALLVLSLGLIALASAIETAVTSINKYRVQQMLQEGAPRATAIRAFLEKPHRFAATLVFLEVLGTVAASALAVHLIYTAGAPLPLALVVLALAGFIISFCHVAPRGIAIAHTEGTTRIFGSLVSFLSTVLSPLIAALTWLGGLFVRGVSGQRVPLSPFITEEEMKLMVSLGEEEGIIEEEEKEMIDSIIEMGETVVREVMVPRIDIVAVEANTPVREALDVILKAGHTRLPIYRDDIDHVIGIVHAKDILRCVRTGCMDDPVSTLARKPYFVPESKNVSDLLKEMQANRVHMAIVIDEYGGTAGLVTIEDLLEEIVGEIQDEYDVEFPLVERSGEEEIIFDGRVSLWEVNEVLGTQWEGEEFESLGGMIQHKLGRLANVGDQLEIDGYILTVLSTERRRIKKVKVVKKVPQEAADGGRNHNGR